MRLKVISFILIFFLLTGCGKEEVCVKEDEYITAMQFAEIFKEKVQGVKVPSGLSNISLTRQEMCSIISYAINNTTFLKVKYIPEKTITERGRESRYFKKLFSGREVTKDSIDNLFNRQMQNAELMNVEIHKMSDNRVISYYIYGNDVGNERFKSIIGDFDSIEDKHKKAVLEACHLGYINIYYGEERYEALFKPEEKVTLSYAKKVIENVVNNSEPSPIDCIKINYWENDEFDEQNNTQYVNLCLDYVPALTICKEFEKLIDKEDKLYFTFGLNNVSLSLWYNCKQFGMLEVPTSFLLEDTLNIEFTNADVINRETRINVASLILNKMHRKDFVEWANNVAEEGLSGIRVFGAVNVSLVKQENSIYVITMSGGI